MKTKTSKTALQIGEQRITAIVLVCFFLIISTLLTATACTEHNNKVNQTINK